MGDDFQQSVGRWLGVAQIHRGAHVVGGGAGQVAQATVEQVLEHALGQAEVLPQVARQTHRHPLAGGEARDDLADRPDVVHVLMGVQVAGAQAVVQAALPLGFEFFEHGVAITAPEPEAGAGQVEVEHAGTVAKRRTLHNALAQRPAIGQVEVQANAAFEQRMPGQDAGRFERRHVGHGGGGADEPGLERAQDHRVFAGTEAEIVSVDYHLPRHVHPP
ncbi:hypothetical protein D3C87_1118340 [compost metagenome]